VPGIYLDEAFGDRGHRGHRVAPWFRPDDISLGWCADDGGLLAAGHGRQVLEIGTGCGYQNACLAVVEDLHIDA